MNPKMWAKLSTQGKMPNKNKTMMIPHNFAICLSGLFSKGQAFTISINKAARIPKWLPIKLKSNHTHFHYLNFNI